MKNGNRGAIRYAGKVPCFQSLPDTSMNSDWIRVCDPAHATMFMPHLGVRELCSRFGTNPTAKRRALRQLCCRQDSPFTFHLKRFFFLFLARVLQVRFLNLRLTAAADL